MNNNNVDTDKHLLKWVDQGLTERTEALDRILTRRLRQARLQALRSESQAGWLGWNKRQSFLGHTILNTPLRQVSALMVSALLVFNMALPLGFKGAGQVQTETSSMDNQPKIEMDVLMSNEEMEFLENLEIYEWLVAEYG